MKYFGIIVFYLVIFSPIECAKILGIFHVPGRSHSLAGSTLMKILAEKGHEVTVVTPYGENKTTGNYTEIVLTGYLDNSPKVNFFDMGNRNPAMDPIIFGHLSCVLMENLFNNTIFQKLMNSGNTYDAVIIEVFNTESLKYVAYHFKAPLIVFSALETNDWVNPYQGNPDNPSYVPLMHLQYTSDMSFLERVRNSILYVTYKLYRVIYLTPYHDWVLHKYYPDAPNLNELSYNVSLALINTDPSIHEPLPRVPSIIGVGGFHIQKHKPLSKDLHDTLDNAKNGVVYFSLGSNVKSKDMPKEKREMLIKAFAKLKETIIWKFEDEDLPGKPANVIIKKWLPQNDIFAHPNVKLFITHGGIFSTMEGIYYGLPLLMLPVFGDQKANAKRAAAAGFAKWLDLKEMTAEDLEMTLKDLLTNPKYAENARTRSNIMKDKPISAQESITYWVEYVIRNKGCDHLKVASLKLNWYQYLLLDVLAFIILVVVIIISFVIYCVKVMLVTKKKQKPSKLKRS